MKKNYLSISAVLLAAAMLSTSCVGSFSLFNKLASWNKQATGSKFLNEIIFLIISPAYAVCSAVDVIVLNTVEFWSGNNPVASNIGKTTNVLGSDGNYYAVKTLKDGYEITSPNGEQVLLVYNAADNSWSMQQNGETREIFRFNTDGTIKATLSDGRQMDVTLNEEGLNMVRQSADCYWAMND